MNPYQPQPQLTTPRIWLTVALFLFLSALLAHCVSLPEREVQRMATAIYKIEGGKQARVPYGILSVKVRDERHAREVCCATIRANWQRWQAAGRPGTFGSWLAARYCPPSADPVGHRNWRKNWARIVGKTRLKNS